MSGLVCCHWPDSPRILSSQSDSEYCPVLRDGWRDVTEHKNRAACCGPMGLYRLVSAGFHPHSTPPHPTPKKPTYNSFILEVFKCVELKMLSCLCFKVIFSNHCVLGHLNGYCPLTSL